MDVGDTIELQEMLTYITNSVYMLLKYFLSISKFAEPSKIP